MQAIFVTLCFIASFIFVIFGISHDRDNYVIIALFLSFVVVISKDIWHQSYIYLKRQELGVFVMPLAFSSDFINFGKWIHITMLAISYCILFISFLYLHTSSILTIVLLLSFHLIFRSIGIYRATRELDALNQILANQDCANTRPNSIEFKFECPDCGQHIIATPEQIGLLIPCPNCGESITVLLDTSRKTSDDNSQSTSLAESFEAVKRKAEDGDAKEQSDLGWMYAHGEGVPQNNVEALKWFQKAANQGDAFAQEKLGVMYANGRGVAKNEVEAVKWYRRAADQGDASAQNNLGIMYKTGRGVIKDEVEAVKWYRKAADQGGAFAQYNLAIMYANGQGVSKDEIEAVKWYRKAADQGNAEAQNNLGVMYDTGRGVPKDEVEAVKWLSIAADQGFVFAQYNLGVRYRDGRGVPKDEVEGLAWYYIAAASGDKDFIAAEKILETKLGAQKASLAQQRSKELLKQIEAARNAKSPEKP